MKYQNLFITLLAVLSVSCATISGGQTEMIKNRKVEFVRTKGNKPAVIFENGLGGEYHWWAKVYPEIAKSHAVFAYDRPGYGSSDPAQTPRDAQTIVAELRLTLQSLGIEPPYILVGHSVGGLYFQYYARRYPEEVKALLLVDSTHPQQMQGDGAIERWPWWVRTAVKVLTPKAGLEELAEVENSGNQVLALPPLDTQKIRTVILLATEPENPTTPLEKNAVEKRQDFHRLYPEASFLMVKGDHAIPLHSPQIIIEQINELSWSINNERSFQESYK